MNIHIDIGHPAHVHLFKNLSWNLQKKGYQLFFSVRSGENEAKLLAKYGFDYRIIGKKKRSRVGKIFGLFLFSYRIWIISRRNHADMYISHGSMYAGYAAFMRNKPHIALEDTGNMEQLRWSKYVSNLIVSPDILGVELGNNHIRYSGNHELAYLGPGYFTHNNSIRSLLGLRDNEPYCLMRFISWGASHDYYQKGFSNSDKQEILNTLSRKYKVFISSEGKIPSSFEKYRFPLKPDMIHDLLAGADFVISEGATISAEAGVLGIPSIYINSTERCYNLEHLNEYGLVYICRSLDEVKIRLKEIISTPDYKKEFKIRQESFLQSKIDVTSFLTWLIEDYPTSKRIMLSNPDYHLNFQ